MRNTTPGVGHCYHCGKKLNPARMVWLELDTRTDEFTSEPVPEEHSQGCFEFGTDCAKKVDTARRSKAA